jgi:uncharacterized protein YacL (UPF0231 family)
MESKFTSSEISALGQILDTTFGRTSTADNATASIKTSLHGSVLAVRYRCIVHFASDRAMHEQKKVYDEESVKLCDDYMKRVKKEFKEAAGRALKVKQISTDDDIEIISAQPHISPKKVAYYTRRAIFDVS